MRYRGRVVIPSIVPVATSAWSSGTGCFLRQLQLRIFVSSRCCSNLSAYRGRLIIPVIFFRPYGHHLVDKIRA